MGEAGNYNHDYDEFSGRAEKKLRKTAKWLPEAEKYFAYRLNRLFYSKYTRLSCGL
jgi:hypothetical protein